MLASGTKIKLGGEEKELLVTPRAALEISKHFNGLQNAMLAVAKLDFFAFIAIIRIALDKEANESDKIRDEIFEAGIFDVQTTLNEYVVLIATGGKPKAEGEEKPEGKPSA